jgi:hypothetical protein
MLIIIYTTKLFAVQIASHARIIAAVAIKPKTHHPHSTILATVRDYTSRWFLHPASLVGPPLARFSWLLAGCLLLTAS